MRNSACPAILTALISTWLFAGCSQRTSLDPQKPDVAAYLDFVLPKRIEIQKYLTKPVSFAGDGNADGILVVLAAYDSLSDQTKVVGQFSFELERYPKVSDHFGEQVAVWPVPVDTDESLREHWDRLTRSYRFPLKLEKGSLKPGKYRLSVRLTMPNGDPLFHQYEFTHEAGAAPWRRADNAYNSRPFAPKFDHPADPRRSSMHHRVYIRGRVGRVPQGMYA